MHRGGVRKRQYECGKADLALFAVRCLVLGLVSHSISSRNLTRRPRPAQKLNGRMGPMTHTAARTAGEQMNRLVEIMRTLRAPGGCPWDREQTHPSLRPFVLEETYEVLEAIEHGTPANLKEELGDFMFEAVFLAQISDERGDFTLADAIEGICDKLVRRHPHVFARESTE